MTDKILRNQYVHVFSTTAARLAYVFSGDDVGNVVRDLENSATYFVVTGGTGAAALARQSTGTICLPVPLTSLREVDSSGDVANTAGIGGVLSADTAPILRADAAEDLEVFWATGNVDPVSFHLPLPLDAAGVALIDGAREVLVLLEVYSGSTDKASFTVESSWNGGALVVDTADDTATKSATRHVITATIAAADVPASPKGLTVALTPSTAHAANGYGLKNVWVIGYAA